MSKRTLLIEKLDSGYIVSEGGKTKAVEYYDSVRTLLFDALSVQIENQCHSSVQNMMVSIEVELNIPKITIN